MGLLGWQKEQCSAVQCSAVQCTVQCRRKYWATDLAGAQEVQQLPEIVEGKGGISSVD